MFDTADKAAAGWQKGHISSQGIKDDTFKEINFTKNNKYKFPLNIVKSWIATTGMIRKELDL